jgi:hypothetical protein
MDDNSNIMLLTPKLFTVCVRGTPARPTQTHRSHLLDRTKLTRLFSRLLTLLMAAPLTTAPLPAAPLLAALLMSALLTL